MKVNVTAESAYQSTHGFNKRRLQQIVGGTTVFLGDSHIQGLNTASISAMSLNLGIGKDTIAGLSRRIVDYPELSQAKQVVILIGINDVLNDAQSVVLQKHIKELASELLGISKIYWVGVLPVVNRGAIGGVVDETNQLIRKNCEMMIRCQYITPPQELYSVDGELINHVHVGDGLHLNMVGYQIFSQHLKSYINASIDRGV